MILLLLSITGGIVLIVLKYFVLLTIYLQPFSYVI
jgi:hypothetical protein